MENRKYQNQSKKKKRLLPMVFFILMLCILFLLFFLPTNSFLFTLTPVFMTSKFNIITPPVPSSSSSSSIPRLAYLISGAARDGQALKRTLRALYHPMNQYILHLDHDAPAEERLDLDNFIISEPIFRKFGNVRLIMKPNMITYRGITMVANTLHAAAILLKEGGDWDWFINLSASDYPLVTQDDLLHTLSTIPRDLNFIEHTSDLGAQETRRAKPIIIDPGLFRRRKSANIVNLWKTREMPTAFKLFTGSAWMMLSRPFVEFCVSGWDNLPRTLLLYYANFVSSPEGYFQTVICNSPEFKNTTVNHDLHFISWDNPPRQHPHPLVLEDYPELLKSNAPFARKFGNNNQQLLDKIDSELLGRKPDGYATSGWFDRVEKNEYELGDITELRPGFGAERLKKLTRTLLSEKDSHAKQCI